MNAIQVAKSTQPRTIGELKQYLADIEAKWTEEDSMYLGAFNDQALYALTKQGVAYCHMEYCGEFGLIAFPIE